VQSSAQTTPSLLQEKGPGDEFCDSHTSSEVKGYVDARIAEGKYTTGQIMDDVAAKYGGRKF
jgi:hypothetical protein